MGRRRNRTNFEVSARLNNTTYMTYFNRLTELALTRFKYDNLPESVNIRFLERTLFFNGSAVFFLDPDLDEFLALPVSWQAGLNVYEEPERFRAYSANGYQMALSVADAVIIWNNYLHTNSVIDIENYALRLYNLDRIIDVNANAQKTPVLVQGTEEQSLTLKNVYKEWDGNAPVIYGYKTLDLDALKVLKTDAPYVADKIYELKTQIWNEALTYLGIPNLTIQKKERVVEDEVARSQGGTVASRYSVLESRREAIDKVNRMFGLDIKVDFRDVDTMTGVNDDNVSRETTEDEDIKIWQSTPQK